MPALKNSRPNFLGFTLIEVLIVLAIIAVVSGSIAFSFIGSAKSSRDGRRRADLAAYRGALELYANSNGKYPVFPAPTKLDKSSCLSLAPVYLGKCQADPRSGVYDYNYQSDAGGMEYCVWSVLERTQNCLMLCSDGKSQEYPASGVSCNPASIP